jgi:hypothetical protein
MISLQPIIFAVKEDDVDPDGGGSLPEKRGNLKENCDPGCPVICAQDRGVALAGIGVLIRPGARIPVSAEEDTVFHVGSE